MSTTSKKSLMAGTSLAALALVAGIWFLPGFLSDDTPDPDRYSGLGGDFQLESLNGPVSLSDFSGDVVLLFFGYTHCPDYCLASMATMRQVLSELPENQQGRVQGLFISVDPDRDDVQTLHEYTQFFHADITGATGPKATIDELVSQYATSYRFVDSDSELDYLVEHGTRTYVLNPDGKIVEIVPHEAPYTEYLTLIDRML